MNPSVLLMTAAILVASAAQPARAQQTQNFTPTLVMPFENVTRDRSIVWLGEASAVLLADYLNALGTRAISREERSEAFERLEVPPAAALTDATVIRIGQIVGASQAVVGTLQVEGTDLVVRARSISLDLGRVDATVIERGPIPDLFPTFERIARRLAQPSSRASSELAIEQPPVVAFENYVKGLLAETQATAVSYFNAALAASPTFARARLALWEVYAEGSDHERALAAVQPVAPESTFFRRARFAAAVSQLNLARYEDAFKTLSALSDSSPTAAVLNNLGVVQLRRGATAQGGLPMYYFIKATEADPVEADYFFNLGYAYWFHRDTQAAIYWLREAVRRDPSDGDAHFILGVALSAAGQVPEANREKELARRLSSSYQEWEKRPAADLVPRGLERIKSDVELPRAGGIDGTLTGGQRDQQELGRFYLDRAWRLYMAENDREALAELSRALFLSPYEAQAHLLVARIHFRAGRFDEAIDALKISLWSAESAEAHAVLAETHLALEDRDAARSEVQRALALDPLSEEARRVLAKLTEP
jgi:tetratricopeptide (TPR) repeat protein